ncbi:PREDICTED: tyrosine-protein phosphatase non-receptor type 23 [Myotis davidii]|uniref:tyrosine-protein phosphatase non-receptor type 23 n=1 Tax=Myotis davidii TaxID=225400 RepID=UPI0003EBB5C9|nr:PREDICTED: tyrosine-protein phosphatase non-receptor type 23 [Myotis davidii]
MEAVPRRPRIWLDLKEAGDFAFYPASKKFVLKNYGENPEAYNEELKKLELLRQNAVRVPRDFEGCSVLRKYLGQLHYLQSRVPMGSGQEAAVPVTWTEIFSGKSVAHEDIQYEQACILYNLGALHSMLGAMDKRVSEEGMKVSCTHFQCAAGAFAYLREHFPHAYSVDMSRQILTLNVNLMLGQAQECLLEKSMLDNRKSFLVARISAQVVDYYKEACRALENPDTASLLGRIQKDWKKLVQMKIYYFAAVAHLHMGKQAEEQQKFGEQVAYFQSALDKLSEAIKLAKGQPDTVQDALRFAMDVIGGKYNSAKKDNDFIYHEAVPALDTLQPVKGAPLVKPLPVNPTDPAVTGPDIFAKLVPMAAHEASSLYSEEKAKLLREIMAKIEDKNEVLDQFMDSMQLDPETVDNLDTYNHIPPQLMEKCAALSVRPDTVRNLVQSMQVLSGVFTDVEASLKDIRDLLEEDELLDQKLQEAVGQAGASVAGSQAELAEVRREWARYTEVHEKASFTNSELHRAMNLHVGNLRLLSGPLDQVRAALPTPALTPEDQAVLQNLKRILAKVQEMRDQRVSLEQQLRELIQKDDITASLVTTDRSEMKKLFEEQLKKYDQLRVYLEQNLAAQDNVLRALTEANVQYAAVRRTLSELDQKWNSTLQTLVASYEAYEDLMKKSQEGKDFYADLESKVAALLERAQSTCQAREAARQQLLDRELKKKQPPRPAQPCFSVPPPQPLSMPYTYPLGPKQPLTAPPAQHHFPPGIPTGFPAPRIGPQPQLHPPRAAFGPQLPQQLPQQPLPLQHPHLFPSQAPGLMTPPPPYSFAPQPAVLGQPPPPLHSQLYPRPSQDPLPPHSGALPFSSPGPPQPPHSTLAYGPAPSPRPLGPQAAPLSIQGPSPASQATPSPHLVPSPAPSPGPGPVPPRPPAADPPPCLRRGTVAADLLSSSPESQHGGTQPPGGGQPLLQPTKVDAAEGRRPQALQLIERDPYERPERLQQLQQELEAFRGQLGDAGALDAVWRELQDAQEHDARGRSIAIARCYSLKNRHQDVMPYDSNRVVLRSGKDDYINASRVEGLSPYCPPLVATQAPLPGTAADFWLMVHEQKVSVIVMLVSEAEMEKQKVARYFPTERGQPMVHGALSLALSSVRTTETHVERVLSLQFRDQSLKRSLHLRFCHEAVVRHVEQVLQRHGVPPPCRPLAGTGISQKNHLPQDSQDLVLGGDVPISSIQATIAKLSIRPPGGLDSPVACLPGPVEPPGLLPASLPQSTQLPSSSPPPLSSPLPETPQPEEEQSVPEVPSLGPPSSSLELLASLTPEAFSLDSSLRGKQRMSKQNFLHAHNGQGLRAAPPADDPLSLLDPLWTLNKT